MAAVTRSNQREPRNDPRNDPRTAPGNVPRNEDGTTAMPPEEPVRDDEGDDGGESQPKPASRGKGSDSRAPALRKSQGFFTLYKKGQGYWTRMGTAIAAGFLGLMIAFELYHQIPTFHWTSNPKTDDKIGIISALVFLAAYSLWVFWFTNKPTTVDFLVATDSEMKKVNWTTRKELIGSTRIVIIFMFLIAFYLFFCDQIFIGIFKLIRVLNF